MEKDYKNSSSGLGNFGYQVVGSIDMSFFLLGC